MDKISIHMKQMNATVIVIVKAISGDSDIGDKHLPILNETKTAITVFA